MAARKRIPPQDIHPRTREDVGSGTPVVIRDARGEFHERIAQTGVEWGRNFLVVWVARPGEVAQARREGRPGDAVPWPAEDVWLPGDAPGVPKPEPGAPPRARIFTWDHNQQPDMEAIAALVAELSGARVVMREVDTGSDEYAWVVADHEVSGEELRSLAEPRGCTSVPCFPDEIVTAAAEALHMLACRVAPCETEAEHGEGIAECTGLARTALEGAAVPLGAHVAGKIAAHAESHGQRGPVAMVLAWRRHFQTAAQVAARAFLTDEDVKRLAAEALASGDHAACDPPGR